MPLLMYIRPLYFRHPVSRSLAVFVLLLIFGPGCGSRPPEDGNAPPLRVRGQIIEVVARNIAHEAVLQGHSALFIEASRMLLDLGAQDSARSLERRLRHYAKPALLCIDEVGYLSYDARAADLLFEVVSRRYEQKSVVISTNLAFSDWPAIFPNASCVTALIDRLTHHADIALIEGESYRLREAELSRKARQAKAK